MPCYKPIPAWQAPFPAAFGPRPKLKFKFEPLWKQIEVPCGGCIGCRLDKSRTWAARCMHEAQLHQDNSFLTLTLDDGYYNRIITVKDRFGKRRRTTIIRPNLTVGTEGAATLNPDQLELFWKRLRKAGFKTRYYAVGEYGDATGRPHYHAIAFGLFFKDRKLYSSKDGIHLYTSKTLNEIWGHGNCWIGDVTFESCAYVARYVMKKLSGKAAEQYEFEGIHPEFARMSRRPGIGSDWYDKYSSDLFPNDKCVIRGDVLITPPSYYTQKYALQNPTEYLTLKKQREKNALAFAHENTPQRRNAKNEVKLTQLKQLLRSFE